MCRDRAGEIHYRNYGQGLRRGMVKKSVCMGERYYYGTTITQWVHFVAVMLPNGAIQHHKWKEDSDSPWDSQEYTMSYRGRPGDVQFERLKANGVGEWELVSTATNA